MNASATITKAMINIKPMREVELGLTPAAWFQPVTSIQIPPRALDRSPEYPRASRFHTSDGYWRGSLPARHPRRPRPCAPMRSSTDDPNERRDTRGELSGDRSSQPAEAAPFRYRGSAPPLANSC